jgi:hypothetical protein
MIEAPLLNGDQQLRSTTINGGIFSALKDSFLPCEVDYLSMVSSVKRLG